jgi:hypothetical protein
MLFRSWYIPFVVALVAASHAAETKSLLPAAGVVSTDRILSALQAAQVPVRSVEVQFLAPIILHQPAATLRLGRLERWQGDSALAKIYCARAGECLPFFVILRWSDPQEREAAVGAPRKTAIQTNESRNAAKPLLVRAGQQVTLLMQNGKMRIATQVICLESGKQGQEIRVTGLDRKRIAAAEVVEAGVLKGNL